MNLSASAVIYLRKVRSVLQDVVLYLHTMEICFALIELLLCNNLLKGCHLKIIISSLDYTGIAYLLTVVALILPYLLFPSGMYIPALACMLGVVILIIAGSSVKNMMLPWRGRLRLCLF